MPALDTMLNRALCVVLLFCCTSLSVMVALGQQGAAPPQPSPAQTPATTTTGSDDILRISTELVQTDVMVFDKQGRFIDNLKPEQFELRVDGRVQPVSFFERVVAGSSDEETQLAAARGVARTGKSSAPVRPADRGRTIFFFIDDLHLSQESILRTRKTLLNYIDREVAQNDQVAITSASGQIGFLQQLTNNKAVLRKAVERLAFRATAVLRDSEPPPMSAVQALEIEQNNQRVLGFFVGEVLRDNPMLRPEIATQMVQTRARRLVQQSDATNVNLMFTLASLMRSTARLPGRKLVFFLSEGFVMNVRDSDIMEKIRRATDAAARSGTVIYSMNPLGLQSGIDATTQAAFDLSGQLPSASTEISVMQDPLRIMASSTGGRALLNTNALDASIGKTLQETSIYYLLAWRPDTEQQKPGKFRRIEAKVIGRPELVVRVRNGYFTTDPATTAKPANKTGGKPQQTAAEAARTPEKELRTAINDVFPRTALPTSVFAYYADQPNNGPVLSLIMAVAPDALELEMKDGRHTGAVDIAGMIFNEEGKAGANFKEQIQLNIIPSDLPRILSGPLFYNYELRIKPGLYQVRVAARDPKTGRTGSAIQWIEIPDLATQKLTMSTLLVGGTSADKGQDESQVSPVSISVDRRFSRDARLRFLTYIYNAQRTPSQGSAPDVALQVQVFRDDQPVITTALSKVKTEGLPDLARIPYAAEVLLDKLPAGQYILKVTAIDRLAKASASQQVDFSIE